MNIASLPPTEELIPHRGLSLLIDRVADHSERATTCLVDLANQAWMKQDDGRVANWLTVEYMAQCIAVHESIRAWIEGRQPDLGLLAAVSGLKLYEPTLAPGQILRVRAERLRGSRAVKAFTHNCGVFAEDGKTVAEGRITVALKIPGVQTSPRGTPPTQERAVG